MFFLATTSIVIIWIALYEYKYYVVFGEKWSYSYFSRIKIRVDTTLYQYDLVCIRPEKIKWGRISYLLVFVPYNFYSYSYWSYRIRPRIRYDLIRPGRISDPLFCPRYDFCSRSWSMRMQFFFGPCTSIFHGGGLEKRLEAFTRRNTWVMNHF